MFGGGRHVFFILLLSLAFACTAKPEPLALSKYASTQPREDDQQIKVGADVLFEIPSRQFQGEESKLEALVTYAGQTSARVKLEAGASLATFLIHGLTTGRNERVMIEIYEAEKLRFRVNHMKAEFRSDGANRVTIEECQVEKLPWTGEGHVSSCGWTVQEVAD